MRRLELEGIGSLFWLVVAIFFVMGGIKVGLGTLRSPGPGLLPVVMAMFLAFLSLFTLIKGLIRPVETVDKIPWKRPILAIASVFVFGLLLNLIGFLLSTFIMMFILFSLLRDKNKWTGVFMYSVATALVAWLVFSVAFKIPFPLPRVMEIWR